MRLIDADALMPSYVVTSTTTNSLCHLYVSIEDINSAPTIDAVSVVRCGECKHSEPSEDNSLCCKQWHDSYGFWEEVKSDDFCSYGERKESER